MESSIFTYVDDSREKLTVDTFFLIFIVWASGMVFGIIAVVVENFVFKTQRKK
jgi:hypothetical protein